MLDQHSNDNLNQWDHKQPTGINILENEHSNDPETKCCSSLSPLTG